MTIIVRTKKCLEHFRTDFKKGLFSTEDGMVLKIWAAEMERWGPEYIASSANWRDHPLHGEWHGYRASCFSASGRIIYRILDDDLIEVCEVARITPNHNYKKRSD